jgi:hypothetical protein
MEVCEQLTKAKEALALLAGSSVAIPNQALLINSITLQDARGQRLTLLSKLRTGTDFIVFSLISSEF